MIELEGIKECKRCEHYIMKFKGVDNHYNEYQREQLRIKCWSCDCDKPEARE